jgi:hypothetical protein
MIQQLCKLAGLRQMLFEEAGLAPLLDAALESRERGLDVANQRQVHVGAPADSARLAVQLHLFYTVLGQKFGEGEIGAQQQDQIGVMNSAVGAAVAEQPGHPHRVGIVVLQPLLPAERKSNGRL